MMKLYRKSKSEKEQKNNQSFVHTKNTNKNISEASTSKIRSNKESRILLKQMQSGGKIIETIEDRLIINSQNPINMSNLFGASYSQHHTNEVFTINCNDIFCRLDTNMKLFKTNMPYFRFIQYAVIWLGIHPKDAGVTSISLINTTIEDPIKCIESSDEMGSGQMWGTFNNMSHSMSKEDAMHLFLKIITKDSSVQNSVFAKMYIYIIVEESNIPVLFKPLSSNDSIVFTINESKFFSQTRNLKELSTKMVNVMKEGIERPFVIKRNCTNSSEARTVDLNV